MKTDLSFPHDPTQKSLTRWTDPKVSLNALKIKIPCHEFQPPICVYQPRHIIQTTENIKVTFQLQVATAIKGAMHCKQYCEIDVAVIITVLENRVKYGSGTGPDFNSEQSHHRRRTSGKVAVIYTTVPPSSFLLLLKVNGYPCRLLKENNFINQY